jgi:LysM repeat protein
MALRDIRPPVARHHDLLLLAAMLLVIAVAAFGWLATLMQLGPLASGVSVRRPPAQSARAAAVMAVATSTPTIAASSSPIVTNAPTQSSVSTAATVTIGPAAIPTASSGLVHVVQGGETVWGIAAAYGVRHDRILAANGLGSDAAISIGQRLVIPGA